MTLKKSALSLAIAGAMGVTSAPALAGDTGGYGRLDVGVLYNSTDEEDENGNDSSLDVTGINSRFGWKGSEDLGNGMSAIYRYEFRVLADQADIASSNRLSYVGLGTDAGTLSIGRQWSSQFNHIGTFLDPTLYTGTGYSANGHTLGGAYRQSDLVKYAGSAGAFAYDIDVRADGSGGGDENFDEYQLHGTFSGGAFSVAAGVRNVVAAVGDDTQHVSVAGSVGVGEGTTIRAGLITASDDSDEDATLIGVNASFSAGGGLSFLIGFDQTTDDDNEDNDTTTVFGGVYKRLSKRTRIYAEFRDQSLDDNDAGQFTNVYGAIRHDY